jgi:hypothetical protein
MIQLIHKKRVLIWSLCLLSAAIFIGIGHFCKDWVNAPENNHAILLLMSLWFFSALCFYFNAIAYAIYGKKSLKSSKLRKGIFISFFSAIMLAACSLGTWIIVMLIFQR